MPLPTIIDAVSIRAIRDQETTILAAAARLVPETPDPDEPCDIFLIREALAAVMLADELLLCHASSNPADQTPNNCATQLKYWHLYQLDNLIADTPAEA